MYGMTPCKKCCIIKSMNFIIEFISLNIRITKVGDIERVTKPESVIWRPECLNVILTSESVIICHLLRFRFLLLHTQ